MLFATFTVGSCPSVAVKPRPSLPDCSASCVGGPRLVVDLRLWASMQDSERLRPHSNSTMQAGTANVCILSICGVGALQADRLGVSRPQLQVQVQVPGAEALAQPDKQFSQSGTNPCIFANLITINTTAQMKLSGSASSLSRRSLLLGASVFLLFLLRASPLGVYSSRSALRVGSSSIRRWRTLPCVRALFSCEPSSIKAQQRVDRDTTEADQELALGRSPRPPRSESQTAAARFALSKCPAVYRESLAFCENFTTFRGKSDVLDPWATLWSSSTSRTSQSNNTSEPRCSAVVQNLVTDRQREEY